MPVERRYSSARFATRRGSFAYGSRVIGSDDLAQERERRRLRERVEDGGGRVRHEQHVALGDPLPAADRGAVEAQPVLEGGLVEPGDGQRDVLPRPEQVAELQVDHHRARLARPLERRPRVDLALEVVPQFLLDLSHPILLVCTGPSKKPQDSESPEAPLPRKPAFSGGRPGRRLAGRTDRGQVSWSDAGRREPRRRRARSGCFRRTSARSGRRPASRAGGRRRCRRRRRTGCRSSARAWRR